MLVNETEPVYERFLAIREKALGPDHPDVAKSLDALALSYTAQGRYAEAEPLYKRSLAIREKALSSDHQSKFGLWDPDKPQLPQALDWLAGRSGIAEKLDVAQSLRSLAFLYYNETRYAEAEPLFRRSLAIREKALGLDHLDVAESLSDLAASYTAQRRYAEAEPLYKRSLAIREKALRSDHPDVAHSLHNLVNLAYLYHVQGRYVEAEVLYKRSLAIQERAFGPDHPGVARILNYQAIIRQAQGRFAEAELLYKRSIAIFEKALGTNHPDLAKFLDNLAILYRTQGLYSDALPIVQRTILLKEARKDVAFDVLYGSQLHSLIAPTQAVEASFTVLQRSFSSAAGKAVSMLAARFAAGSDELAQLVRQDQDLTAEADP
jgi:tetratricopeptide (TPR) repeat protein